MKDDRRNYSKNTEKSTPSERNEWSNGIFLKFGMGEKDRNLEKIFQKIYENEPLPKGANEVEWNFPSSMDW